MQQNFSKWSAVTLFCVLALTLVTAPGAAQDRPVLGPSGITYDPAIDYERATLTIAGMGQVWQQTVADGSRVVFDLVGPEGELLRDGEYTWELRLVPLRDGGAVRRDDVEAGFEGAREIPGAVHSGYFTIAGGQVALDEEEVVPGRGTQPAGDPQTRDQQILDDLIVVGSACVGQDCVNGENFGFDTIKVKENNLRIKFEDTSNSASFPTNDWQITANDSSNGGANKFSIDDIDGGRTPFTIRAGAPANSLFVSSAGRIGLRTATPTVELHVVDGDTPTLRLEQDGSSGFGLQTWDLAGNETNLFIRDATNGSKLPFRIKPAAPTNSLFIKENGDVGIGTQNPDTPIHVDRADGRAQIHIEDSADGNQQMLHLEKTGNNIPFMRFTGQFGQWDFIGGNNFTVSDPATGVNELVLTRAGDLTIQGQCSEQATGSCADYVFEPGYEYLSLDELEDFVTENQHLPNVPSTAEIRKNGLSVQNFQGRLLEKIEELVLYTLEQQDEIDELKQANAELLEIQQRLVALEEAADVN